MNRKETLAEAERIVCGERQGQYGSPEDSFKTIAKFWSDYLKIDIEPKQVADLMILLKMARISEGKYKADNYIDIIGYSACANEIESSEDIVKPKFRFEDYIGEGKYVMHCDTIEKAIIFSKFERGASPSDHNAESTYWGHYGEKTCCNFNCNTFGSEDTYREKGYQILEFDDYDWSDYDDTKSEKK